jgi:hypothetical protein
MQCLGSGVLEQEGFIDDQVLICRDDRIVACCVGDQHPMIDDDQVRTRCGLPRHKQRAAPAHLCLAPPARTALGLGAQACPGGVLARPADREPIGLADAAEISARAEPYQRLGKQSKLFDAFRAPAAHDLQARGTKVVQPATQQRHLQGATERLLQLRDVLVDDLAPQAGAANGDHNLLTVLHCVQRR